MFVSPLLGYVGFGIAILAIACGVIFPEYSQYLWMVASLFGYAGVAQVRATVDSKGWKTYAIFGLVVVLTGLALGKVITPELYDQLVVAFAPVTGITFTNSLSKANAIAPGNLKELPN